MPERKVRYSFDRWGNKGRCYYVVHSDSVDTAGIWPWPQKTGRYNPYTLKHLNQKEVDKLLIEQGWYLL